MLNARASYTLSKHFLREGAFSPFTYTIGLESSLREAFNSVKDYPIPQPISSKVMDEFVCSLTLYHELTHLCQFTSTAYGLRTLRYTNNCLVRLLQRPGWTMPIATNLLRRLNALSRDEMRMFEASIIFLDGLDQLRLHHSFIVSDRDFADGIEIRMKEWSPHFFAMEPQDDTSKMQYAQKLKAVGAHLRNLPFIYFRNGDTVYGAVINVALLMECAAILGEMNHISNAMDISFADSLQFLPPGNEYHALIRYALDEQLCSVSNVIPTLGVIVDASLMYDPFVLYDVPWDAPNSHGVTDCYPGETFVRLCAAARSVTPIKSLDNVEPFYRDICKAAGLPSPQFMAEQSRKRADILVAKIQDDSALLAKSFRAHRDALDYRCKTPELFPVMLPTSDVLLDIFELVEPCVSAYNLTTGSAEHFDPRKIDCVTLHSLLFDAISADTLDCPLKRGNPFFCDSAAKDANVLCLWKHEHGTSECLVDVLERQCGLEVAVDADQES